MKSIFKFLVGVMTLIGDIAIAIGVLIAIVYDSHIGATVASIGMITYLVNVMYLNRRSLFGGEF